MHPSSIRGSQKYSKSGPKPGAPSSCLSAKTAQCLIALPLVLALFALSLQVSCIITLLCACDFGWMRQLQAELTSVTCVQWTTRDRTGQRQPLSMPEGFATRYVKVSSESIAGCDHY